MNRMLYNKINLEHSMKILTYNVSWEAMSSNLFGEICGVPSKCKENVIKFIKGKGPFDIIGIQEYAKIIDIDNMNYILWNSGINKLETNDTNATIYNIKKSPKGNGTLSLYYNKNRFKLINVFPYYFGHPDRPFIIAQLNDYIKNNTIMVIVCHAGHDYKNPEQSIYQLETHIDNYINKFKNNFPSAKIDIKSYIKNKPLIVLGDMNHKLKKPFKLYNKKLRNRTKVKTCCDKLLRGKINKVKRPYDHILISNELISKGSYVHEVEMASDHLPATSIIGYPKLNINIDKKYYEQMKGGKQNISSINVSFRIPIRYCY